MGVSAKGKREGEICPITGIRRRKGGGSARRNPPRKKKKKGKGGVPITIERGKGGKKNAA